MKKLSVSTIEEIKSMRSQNTSLPIISKALGISISVAKKYSVEQSTELKLSRGGRPLKISPRLQRSLVRKTESGIFRNAREAQNYAQETMERRISIRTMRRYLNHGGLVARSKVRKPRLLQNHITDRKKFVRRHQNKSLEWWNQVCFTDEKKWNLYGPDGNRKVYRKPGKAYLPHHFNEVVKFGGGGIMTWGVITSHGVGKLYFTSETINSESYISILDRFYLSTLSDFGIRAENSILQQDNASIHKSRITKNWLQRNNIDVLEWPAQSPDLNIIENVWSDVDRRLRSRIPSPKNLSELREMIEEEWYSTDPVYIKTLYESIPRRIIALKIAKGGHTKY